MTSYLGPKISIYAGTTSLMMHALAWLGGGKDALTDANLSNFVLKGQTLVTNF